MEVGWGSGPMGCCEDPRVFKRETPRQGMAYFRRHSHLTLYAQKSRMSHDAAMADIDLLGKEVLPVIGDW